MGRWVLLMVAGVLASCTSPSDYRIGAETIVQSVNRSLPGDPPREEFGVSAARPANAPATLDPQTEEALRWRVSQFCTVGYDVHQQLLENAEENQQLVDWLLRCRPYRFTIF